MLRADAAVEEMVMGEQIIITTFVPCDGSTWPADSIVTVGLLSLGDGLKTLEITRSQYLQRLARRARPADLEALRATMTDPDQAASQPTIGTGILALDEASIHFGFIQTDGSRDTSTWRTVLLRSSLMRGHPVLVMTRGPYGDLDAFRALLALHVAMTSDLVAANTTQADVASSLDLWWLKYQIGALVVLAGAILTGCWWSHHRKHGPPKTRPDSCVAYRVRDRSSELAVAAHLWHKPIEPS